ncbi:MAG: hypothetical protein K5891_03500 [Lachnospiraceae bacterium]|nr:hypothetical protein [Lachnospiraceae bacterium]
MTLAAYFEQLKTKDIVCWGSGKRFRSSTLRFLQKSGLLDRLRGFVDIPGTKRSLPDGESMPLLPKERIAQMDRERTVILIAVSGYDEVLAQLRADAALSAFEAIPSMYPEFLYEDLQLLTAEKPPLHYHKHDAPVIPKVIHAIWFSGDPLPDLYRKCLDSWKRYAPDFEIRIWDLNSYRPEGCLFFDQAIADGNWAFASDYARADILRRYGGVYMDLDVEMLRPIDDLLYNDAYMGFESMDRIECGSGMGAAPGHPVLQEICESYERRPYRKEDGSWDTSTCPVRYTQIIEKHGLRKNGSFQSVEDITIYPFETLTCKSFDTGVIYRTEHSYTVHHHNGSWIPHPARQAVLERYEEIRKFLEERDIQPE